MTITIDCTKLPVAIGDQTVNKLTITVPSFVQYADTVNKAQDAPHVKTEADARRAVFRARIKGFCKGTKDDGSLIPFSDEDISRIPAQYVAKIKNGLDASLLPEDGAGKFEVLRAGDGITIPIHIKLGSPIATGQGKPPIAELEFEARNLDAIEDIVIAESKLDAIRALMAIAQPVGHSLSVLPSWALDRITLADGLALAMDVLPNFLQADAS